MFLIVHFNQTILNQGGIMYNPSQKFPVILLIVSAMLFFVVVWFNSGPDKEFFLSPVSVGAPIKQVNYIIGPADEFEYEVGAQPILQEIPFAGVVVTLEKIRGSIQVEFDTLRADIYQGEGKLYLLVYPDNNYYFSIHGKEMSRFRISVQEVYDITKFEFGDRVHSLTKIAL
jgi:hypothetical protein